MVNELHESRVITQRSWYIYRLRQIFQQRVTIFIEELSENSLLTPKQLRLFRESLAVYNNWRGITYYDEAPVKQLTLYEFSASLLCS